MTFGSQVSFEELRIAASADISDNYKAIGGGLIDRCRVLLLTNDTDAHALVSFDGRTDHLRLAEGTFKLFDFSTNGIGSSPLFLASNTTIFVRHVTGSAPTTGNFWVEVVHAGGGI